MHTLDVLLVQVSDQFVVPTVCYADINKNKKKSILV